MTSRTGKPIVIADYDPQWPRRFVEEREVLYRACGRDAFVRIEHVGSTAVPGLAAKPIIDIMPGVRDLDAFAPLIPRIESIGYQYVPEFEKPIPELNDPGMPFRRYFRKDVAGERAFHLHVVEFGSDFWRKHLRFRNYLRYYPEDRNAYAQLKRALAAEFNERLTPASNINAGYTDRKSDFVDGVLAKFGEQIEAHKQIAVPEYDERWPAFSEAERSRLAAALGPRALAIEHIGSTSVPGLPAKPVIDTVVGIADMSVVEDFRPIMLQLGYIGLRLNEPDWGYAPRRTEEMSYNTHFVPYHGERWSYYLDFRDYLRAHPDVAAAYAALKRANAAEFDRDILGYIEAKAEFVEEARARGAAWRAAR